MNTRDLQLRSVIKFLTKEGKKPKEIHEMMSAVYGEVSLTYYQVKFYFKQFKWGRESIEDYSRSGRPVEASSRNLSGVGNLLKTIHVQVGQWKNLQRKCAKKWRT